MLLDTEQEFSKELIKRLPTKFQLIKSNYKFCIIDFILINNDNLKVIYLEHKRRFIKGVSFPSIWIKVSKVRAILKNYGKFIFVNTLNDDLYFITIDNKTIDKYEQETNIYNELVLNIKIEDFNNGFDDLSNYLIHTV